MLLLTYSILLKYCPAKKVMRGEANILLRASAERLKKNKKYDLKCSFSNAHGCTAKYWTVRPVSPRAGVGMRYLERLNLVFRYEAIINQRSLSKYYETTALPLYCI